MNAATSCVPDGGFLLNLHRCTHLVTLSSLSDSRSHYCGLIIFSFHQRLYLFICLPGRVAQSVGHLTRKSGVLGSIYGLATYFRFSFHFFKKGSCQLLAKVCARSTG